MVHIAYFIIAGATLLAFVSLGYLLHVKRIDSNNTLFFACVIVLLYVVCVVAVLPQDADNRVVMGLVSIGSALVGFLSRGIVESAGKSKRGAGNDE